MMNRYDAGKLVSVHHQTRIRGNCEWPYDLVHFVTCCARSEIISIKFDLRQLIRAWWLHVTLWPLTSWHWTLQHFGCPVFKLCKIWAKSNNPRLSYWRFSAFSRALSHLQYQLCYCFDLASSVAAFSMPSLKFRRRCDSKFNVSFAFFSDQLSPKRIQFIVMVQLRWEFIL